MQYVLSSGPLELVAVDLPESLPIGKRGLKHIFVVLDTFIKYVKMYPIRSTDAKTVERKMMQDYISEVGHSKMVLSDHNTQFTSARWKENLVWEAIWVGYTAIHHPQAERVMWELSQIFQTFFHNKHTTWTEYVKETENLLNNNKHESTGIEFIELMLRKRIDRIQEISINNIR